MINKLDSLPKILVPILVLLAYGLLLAKPVNLVTADLGRHIRNGEALLAGNFEVLKTNFYSYTYPDFPAANHHWLGGVIYYLVWKFSGFTGLHIFFIAASLTAFFIFFNIATKRASTGWAGLLSVLVIPLLLERDEIRPEVFSYVFGGIFWWLMLKYRDGEISWKNLLILPVLTILWVNLHIYFFLGFIIVGTFLLESLILKNWAAAKRLGLIFLLTLVASLINPHGLDGALAPFSIFQNFGYRLAENQTVWFIEKILPNPNYFVFKISFLILILSLAARIGLWLSGSKGLTLSSRSDLKKNLTTDIIFTLGFSVAAWLAIRNFTIFSLFALPMAAGNLAQTFNLKTATANWLNRTAITTLILVILIILSGELGTLYPKSQNLQLGLEKDNEKALEFFRENKLTGPIFNNYDIGGYLIYGLPTGEKVFTDNRPEAYPTDFFASTYIPMQTSKKTWDEKSALYKFNAIIFSYRDYTPWGQAFFARILEDPEWKTVFADSRVVILLKNNEINKDIIAKYGQTLKIKVN